MDQKTLGLWTLGVIVLLSAQAAIVGAQTAASFDGTYAFVSAAKLSQTYVTRSGDMGFCPESAPGPLYVSQGRAWYVSSSGRNLVGTLGQQGQFVIQVIEPRDSRPFEMDVNGRIDPTGRAYARQRGNSCSYDLVWQKQQ